MKNKHGKRVVSLLLAAAMLTSMTITASADTWPYTDHSKVGDNQPLMLGHRLTDIENWSPETDPYADLMRAEVPLQQRITPYAATQANPDLGNQVQVMYMAGDYGNSFNQGTPYNNQFSENMFNFWQYVDYYCSWHGSAVAGTPLSIWTGYNELADGGDGWKTQRNFEFGSVNMPNPGYTNAAHRNGVLSMGCVYFDPNNRPGQPVNAMFKKDADGRYIVADKLKEFADWYGFDGYFFNQEESVPSNLMGDYKAFIKQCRESGLYCQMYDSLTGAGNIDAWRSTFNQDVYNTMLEDAQLGSINDSVFISYDWSYSNKMATSLEYIEKLGVNPFERVFFGVEGNQGRMATGNGIRNSGVGHNSTWNFANYMYQKDESGNPTKNLVGSVALFTPDAFIHDQIEDVINDKNDPGNPNDREKDDYQWMVMERERLYFSGANEDPTNTDVYPNREREDLGLTGLANDIGGWPGVADFKDEESVVNGGNFVSNFNTGHGMQYFINGAVSNDEEWGNMNLQGILPTWQWWVESTGSKLSADFDYGTAYTTKTKNGDARDLGYTQIGGYNGGSSLVVNGALDADNLLHLFKTDLSVVDGSKATVTFYKSSDDSAAMQLALYLKDQSDPVFIDVPESAAKSTGWVTKEISLGEYAGKNIAAIGLNFTGTADSYQMNIGEIKISDGADNTPAAPEGFQIEDAFNTKEAIVEWTKADYSEVTQYNLYATYADGSKSFVGGTYGSKYYIKSLGDNVTGIELTAIGVDGSESAPARVEFDYGTKVSNIAVEEEETSTGYFVQSKYPGEVHVSWTAPQNVDFDSYALELSVNWDGEDTVYTATAGKDATSAVIKVPVNEGEKYTLKISTVKDGVKAAPVSRSGYLKDTYCAPFDNEFVLSGTSLYLHSPTASDWWKIEITMDGQKVNIPNKYGVSNTQGWKGVARLNAISLPSNNGLLGITMTDYSGNVSDTTYIYLIDGTPADSSTELTDQFISDPVLLAAVKEQIGDKLMDVINSTGSLDLSNLDIQDYSGLKLLGKLTSLNLTGSKLTALAAGDLPNKLQSLSLSNCANLTTIEEGALPASLQELDITGCAALTTVYANSGNLEKLSTTAAEGEFPYPNIYLFDISGNKMDLSAGTPEGEFVAAFNAYLEQNPIDPIYLELQNIAVGSSNNKLTDGNTGNYEYVYANSPINFDLGKAQTVESFRIRFYSDGYKAGAFKLEASTDGTNYSLVKEISDNQVAEPLVELETPVTARYFRITLLDRTTYLREIELNGRPLLPYGFIYGDQQPAAYISYDKIPASVTMLQNGAELRVQNYFDACYAQAETVRGTLFSSLKGADWVAESYDIQAQIQVPAGITTVIIDAEGNESADPLTAKTAGAYTVEFRNASGEAVASMTVKVVADKESLNKMIAACEALSEADYTPATWADFSAKLAEAKALAEEEFASQSQVDEMVIALVTVKSALESKPQTNVLDLFIEIAENLDTDGNTPATVAALKEALNAAKAVRANENATQDEVNAAAKTLSQAINNLLDIADNSRLVKLIKAAEKLNPADYTPETVAPFQEALNAAKAVAANQDATPDDIEKAYKDLAKAIADLELDINRQALASLVEQAEEMIANIDKYRPSTVTNLKAETEAAKAVLDDANATQQQINEAADKLAKVIGDARVRAVKVELVETVQKAEQVDTTVYTAESVQAMQEALNAAKTVIDDADADQDVVDIADRNLKAALSGLQKLSDSGKPSDNTSSTDNGSSASGGSNGTSATGDNMSLLVLILALALISGAAVVVTVRRKKAQ